jgi:hypothetical protein
MYVEKYYEVRLLNGSGVEVCRRILGEVGARAYLECSHRRQRAGGFTAEARPLPGLSGNADGEWQRLLGVN